jgi:hypothetical protein
MFNRSPLFIYTCGKCRRLFEDRSVKGVARWMVANLDAEVWPDYDMVWDRTTAWEPPESLTDLEVRTGKVWQATSAGERRRGGA